MRAGRSAGTAGEVWLSPVVGSPPVAGPAPSTGAPLQMMFTSLGVSTGEGFEVQIVNNGPRPVRIDTLSLVLEPLSKEAGKKVREQMQRVAAGKATKLKLNAYCIEFLRQPPTAGSTFRIAPADVQQKFAPVRKIFQASRRLLRDGALEPDSEPKAYFHSIRQWAVWTAEQRFDRNGFERAFVEHTRKNVQAGGRKWTSELDKAIRGAVPHRWRQINKVLEASASVHDGPR